MTYPILHDRSEVHVVKESHKISELDEYSSILL